MSKTEWYCIECGGTNVEKLEFVRPNEDNACDAGDGSERYDCRPDLGETWCDDCEDSTQLKQREVVEEPKPPQSILDDDGDDFDDWHARRDG